MAYKHKTNKVPTGRIGGQGGADNRGPIKGHMGENYPGSGGTTAGKTARTMTGASGGGSKKAGKSALNSQGDRAGGMRAGLGRTKTGSKKIGSNREQGFT